MRKLAHSPLLLLCLGPCLLMGNTLFAQGFPDELPNVVKTDGSRIKRDESSDDITVNLETDVTTSITIPGVTFVPCQATISLGYSQRNTLARVHIDIEHQACKVSTGSLEIVTSIRNDEGVSSQLVFPESWEQTGNEAIAFQRDYAIGENVTLTRVRSRRVTCECTQEELLDSKP